MIKIYYMTGTGNSLKIAKDIGIKLGDHKLVSMPHLLNTDQDVFIEGDIIGFVIPVYFGRPPVFFQEFIRKARFGKSSYIFAVANGGGLFGRTLDIVERLLKRKGQRLNAGFLIRMPGTHPYIPFIHGKSFDEHYRKEAVKTDLIAGIVRKKQQYRERRPFRLIGSIFSFFAFDTPYDLSKKHSMDNHFWINDGCRNCGLCIKICPVNNIIQSRWKPEWQHRCINCLSCYHLCPVMGIELKYDWKMIDIITYEMLNFRYRHPDISLQELMHPES